MANAYKGEAEFKIKDKVYNLVFNWNAIAEIQTHFGEDVISKVTILGEVKPSIIAAILAAGMKENHPEMTEEEIMKLSPPIHPAIRAIDDALSLAYFGPDGPPKAVKGDAQQTDGKKKTS